MRRTVGFGKWPTVALATVLMMIAGCVRDQGVTAGDATIEGEELDAETSEPLAFEPEQAEAIDHITVAIEDLLANPALEVSYVAETGDGGSSVGAAHIDNSSGNYSIREEYSPTINPDLLVVSEQVLLDENLFVRILDSNSETDSPWSRTEPGSLRDKLVGEAYMASGAAGASLNRLIVLLESVPWSLEASNENEIEGRSIISYLVRFGAEDIWQFFGVQGLEIVGPLRPQGDTMYEFWIDASTSELATLQAAGVQFQDGEPLEGARIRIDYRPTSDLTIEEPGPLRD